jgi:hypothetical protein
MHDAAAVDYDLTTYRSALRRIERVAHAWRKSGVEPSPAMLGLTWYEYAELRSSAAVPSRMMGLPS